MQNQGKQILVQNNGGFKVTEFEINVFNCITKLLNSDWLKAVLIYVKKVQKELIQGKNNSVQFTHKNVNLDWLKNKRVGKNSTNLLFWLYH